MKILFCLPGFNKNSIKLQPWLTVYNVAKYLSRNKYEIYILTDCNNIEIIPEIQTYTVKSLRQTNMNEIVNVIKEVTPEEFEDRLIEGKVNGFMIKKFDKKYQV